MEEAALGATAALRSGKRPDSSTVRYGLSETELQGGVATEGGRRL
jgi:hypothetical protein